MSDIDGVFRPSQSDFEMGDAYEQGGHVAVFKLEKARREATRTAYNENHVALDVAQSFGVSPGDLYYDDDGAPFNPAALAAFYMGQT